MFSGIIKRKQKDEKHTDLSLVFLRRLHGDEICRRDAADVWSVLHSQVVWRRQTVLVSLLRVRQDHAQGEDAVCLLNLGECTSFVLRFSSSANLSVSDEINFFSTLFFHFRMDLHQLNFS